VTRSSTDDLKFLKHSELQCASALKRGLVGGLCLGRRILRGREEKVAGSGAELAPKVAEDFEVVAARNVLGAEGEAQCEIETDTEIQHEGGGDAEAGPDEGAAAEDFRPAGSHSEGHGSGGKGDVADIERHSEEVSEDRSHAEHEAKDDGAAPPGNIFGEGIGKTQQGFGFERGAPAVLGDGPGQLVVDGPILDPATGKTGEPENDAGENGVENRTAVERIEGLYGVLCGFGREEWLAIGEFPKKAEHDRADANGDDIPQSGSELGAKDALDVVDELSDFGSVAVVVDDAREGGAGHGGLLGGEREMEILHEDKADGVVEP
jgi:hypothetical protein